MRLANVCARARAVEAEVLFFSRSMFFDAIFSFCNGLDSSAFFHFAIGWIPPPMFALFCNGLDSSATFFILK